MTPICLRLLLIATVLLWCGCAAPGPQGPVHLYEFDSVWFNDDVGGVRPGKRDDRRAATRAALAREQPGRTRARPARRRPGKSVAKKASGSKRVASRRASTRRKPKAAAPAPLGSQARVQASPRRAPRKKAARQDLGDGSVSSELVAAARRLVGLRRGADAEPFLAHLMQVAAVRMKVKAPRDLYNAAAWRLLSSQERVLDGDAPMPGDLVFFHDTHDRDGDGSVDDPYSMVAVVESVRPSGSLVCVGDAYNRVIRFSMNASRPGVRRDDRSGEVMNTPIRKRTRHDGPQTPVLAGQLYAGMARL